MNVRRILNSKSFSKLHLRFCTIKLDYGNLNNKFTQEEQQHVLNILNNSSEEQLSLLDIPKNRIKNLKNWQKKWGSFGKVSDVLEVDGLGIKILEKICESIIERNGKTVPASKVLKNRRQYVTPLLTQDTLKNFSSAVGLHFDVAGISWAKLSANNQLQQWNCFKFDEFSKKPSLIDTFMLLHLRFCTIKLDYGNLNNKFTQEEQQHVLNILNNSSEEQLSLLDIPKNRIKNLKNWQKKWGSFGKVSDVLEVDGLGIKILEKICESIIERNGKTVPASKVLKNRRQYVTPLLTQDTLKNFSSAVGLHFDVAGISWAKLSANNQLQQWNCFKFDEFSKKPSLIDTFMLLHLRFCTIKLDYGNLNNKFTQEEQQHVLNILNNSSEEQLSLLDIPKNRIKNLKNWQKKWGSFGKVSDVLEVDGLGIKILEKICESIIERNGKTVPASKVLKNRRQYVTPLLTQDTLKNFSSAVGLHFDVAGISWAKLSANNQLQQWNCFKFDEFSKKPSLIDTFMLVKSVLPTIPTADVYIFETPPSRSPLSIKQSTFHNYSLEIQSMLLALINTGPHNLQISSNTDNCVHYLKSNLTARLFRTLMGTEKVSSSLTVNNLLESNGSEELCCKLDIDNRFKVEYNLQSAIGQELLGQALLLIVTFAEICVNKNSACLALLSRNKKSPNNKV
ncbi:hypothetical protein FQA39_LY07769 [Lamprigera yunnana]|nr:hypothetical protein FQA39_LY07769 [Lamprigera yunnana]